MLRLGATLCEAFDVGMERDKPLKAFRDLRQGPCAMGRAAAVAARVNVGEAEDLTGARVDKDQALSHPSPAPAP